MSEVPRYELISAFYVNDRIIPEGSFIEYGGVPNEAMVPQNDAAREMMQRFIEKMLGGRKTPALSDQVYDAMLNRPREEAAFATVTEAKRAVPMMGTLPIEGLAKPPPPNLETKVVAAPTDPQKKFTRVMGTVQSTPLAEGAT